jgi:hypothetical protein
MDNQQGVLLHIWELGVELTKLYKNKVPSAVILMRKFISVLDPLVPLKYTRDVQE